MLNKLGDGTEGLDPRYMEAMVKAQTIKEQIKKNNTPEEVARRRAHQASLAGQGWTPISSAVDSAASSSVIPLELADTYELQESPGSSADQCWASATGELIPNVGQRTLAALTHEGRNHKAHDISSRPR